MLCIRYKSHKLRDVRSAKFHLLTKFNTRVSVGTNCKTGVKRKSQLYCLSSPEAVQGSVSWSSNAQGQGCLVLAAFWKLS